MVYLETNPSGLDKLLHRRIFICLEDPLDHVCECKLARVDTSVDGEGNRQTFLTLMALEQIFSGGKKIKIVNLKDVNFITVRDYY